MSLKITTRKEGTTYIGALEGPVDTDAAHLVEEWAHGAWLGGAKKLVFDLTGVPYVASAGLGVFVKTMHSFPGVAFAALSPYVAQTFRISGLDRIGKLFPTVEDALK